MVSAILTYLSITLQLLYTNTNSILYTSIQTPYTNGDNNFPWFLITCKKKDTSCNVQRYFTRVARFLRQQSLAQTLIMNLLNLVKPQTFGRISTVAVHHLHERKGSC